MRFYSADVHTSLIASGVIAINVTIRINSINASAVFNKLQREWRSFMKVPRCSLSVSFSFL